MSNQVREQGIDSILGESMTFVLFMTIVFTAMALGTAAPWGIAIFGMLVVVLFMLWAIKCSADKNFRLFIPSTAWPLAFLLVYGLIQSLSTTDETGRRWSVSMDIEATRMTLEVGVLLLMAFILSATLFSRIHRIDWWRNFIIVFGLALAIFGMIQHFSWNGKFYWVYEPLTMPSSPFGPFFNHNHFAGYMEMIVPIPVALVLTRVVRGEIAVLYSFAAILMSVATIISLSRGGMVSLLAGLMFVVIFGLRPAMMREEVSGMLRFPLFLSRAVAAIVIIVAITAGVAWVGADSVISRIERTELTGGRSSAAPGGETFYQSRGWIWRDTMRMIRENWIMGVGLGAYQTAYTIYSERDGSLIVGQAHNDYLQVLADSGIIGAAAALCFIFFLIREMMRAARHRDRLLAATAVGCAGGAFAIMVHSLFDFNLQMPSNALLFLVLVAVLANIARSAAKARVSQAMPDREPALERRTRELEVWS